MKDSEDRPLEGVYILLSSGKTLKVNGTTGANGKHKFVGLNAGKFYMSAILKEYQFDISQNSLELKDGEHAEKVLVAKRVAFSAYGQVNKINGLPLDQGKIIAKCDACDRTEETNID